jgi:hypothetical protein
MLSAMALFASERMNVSVCVLGSLSKSAVMRAEAETAAVFHSMDIEIAWAKCGAGPVSDEAARQHWLTVRLRSDDNPVTYQFSLGVDEQLGHATVVTASYVGNQSRNQFDYQDINLPPESLLPALINKTVSYNTVLPYLGFGPIAMGENGENAHYNGMQLSVRAQPVKDLMLQGAYTLSRAMDPAESFGGDNTSVFNPYNVKYDWGPSLVDATHIGVLSFVYDLPVFRTYGNHFAKTALGGWEATPVPSAGSARPGRPGRRRSSGGAFR